jgi:hypothetical protein
LRTPVPGRVEDSEHAVEFAKVLRCPLAGCASRILGSDKLKNRCEGTRRVEVIIQCLKNCRVKPLKIRNGLRIINNTLI